MAHELTEPHITITAASLPVAVEQLLSRILLQEQPDAGSGGSFIVSYGVEADDVASLISRAIEEIGAIASDQDAAVIACEVSGLWQAGEGGRLWGTIECVPSTGGIHQATRVDDIVYEQASPARWQLSARIITKTKESL